MDDIQIPDNIPTSDKLAAMELVAKMRAAANKVGAGFIGGFIAPDGTKFIQTNLDDEDDINNLLPDNLR
jgi:selenophosphate synthetase-related protein